MSQKKPFLVPEGSSSSDATSPLQLVQSSSSGSRSRVSSSKSLNEDGQTSPEIRKRSHVRVACNSCRAKKLKCNGDRPTCTACQDRDIVCVYDSDPSSTRFDNLKRRTVALEDENIRLRGFVEMVRHRPRREVDLVIERLRQGDDVHTAIEHANPGHMLSRVMHDGISAQERAGIVPRLEESEPRAQRPVAPSIARSPHPPERNDQWQRDKRMAISMVLTEEEEHAAKHPRLSPNSGSR